jgi:hypothetical protein
MSYQNLKWMLGQADDIDWREGIAAYVRYRETMADIADTYGVALRRVVGAFVALSPNNDYVGNLRSLISLLAGIREGRPLAEINSSTYRHALQRAYGYATGAVDFEATVDGLKIRSFYFNILDPSDRRFVAVDGHMSAAWRGTRETMKQAIVRNERDYAEIEHATKRLARAHGLIPCQAQAIIWFTRKRLLRIKYDGQLDMFTAPDNVWRNRFPIEEIRPYAPLLTRQVGEFNGPPPGHDSEAPADRWLPGL